jgi:hypothetical protein
VGDGIPLGRIAGIRVAASWTLLIVVALLVLGLAGGVFPREYPGLTAGWYLAAAAVGAALFLVSLLAHELAHALVARRAGIAVESITFWLFGGVARLSGDAGNPTAALWIALVGPLTSLALAGVFWAAASGLRGAEAAPVVAGVPGWLAWTNLGLALFNLLPGAPWTAAASCGHCCGCAPATATDRPGPRPGPAGCSASSWWASASSRSSPAWAPTGCGSPSSAGSWAGPPAPRRNWPPPAAPWPGSGVP